MNLCTQYAFPSFSYSADIEDLATVLTDSTNITLIMSYLHYTTSKNSASICHRKHAKLRQYYFSPDLAHVENYKTFLLASYIPSTSLL